MEFYVKKLLSQKIGAMEGLTFLRESSCMNPERRRQLAILEIIEDNTGLSLIPIKKAIQKLGWAEWLYGEITHLGFRSAMDIQTEDIDKEIEDLLGHSEKSSSEKDE